jgi:hypothetical protein
MAARPSLWAIIDEIVNAPKSSGTAPTGETAFLNIWESIDRAVLSTKAQKKANIF